jgi:hypothetical protein
MRRWHYARMAIQIGLRGLSVLLCASILAACATAHSPPQPLSPAPTQTAPRDPTPHEIYDAWKAGHVEQAQQMIARVLQNHPKSATAHYVAASILAGTGDVARGREELKTAEELDPSLSFAHPDAIEHLRQKLQGGTE